MKGIKDIALQDDAYEVEARCRTDVPPLRDDGSGHLAACFSGPSFLLHPEA